MAVVEIVIQARNTSGPALKEVQADLRGLGVVAQESDKHTGGFFRNMASTAGGFLAANVIGGLTTQFTGFLHGIIDESTGAAEGLAATNAVLASTKGIANVTAEQVNALASSLQLTTKFSDDQVVAGENMLLTFTNVRNRVGEGNDVFDQATKTLLNMSQALGTDTATQAIQLGKALNDPIGGVSALQRVGVTFTDSQKAVIQSLMDTGDVAGAQKVILQELQTEFGGAAEAAGTVLPGKLAILGHRWDDVKQALGDRLMPTLMQGTDLLAGPVLDAVAGLADSIGGSLAGGLTWLTGTAIPTMIDGWNTLMGVLGPLRDYFAGVNEDGDYLNDWLTALPRPIASAAQFFGQLLSLWRDGSEVASGLGEQIGFVADMMLGWSSRLGPLQAIGIIFDDLRTGVQGVIAALVQGNILGALDLIARSFVSLGGDIRDLLLPALADVGTNMIRWIVQEAPIIAQTVVQWGQSFVSFVAPFIPPMLVELGRLALAAGQWILAEAPVFVGWLAGWGDRFVSWVAPQIPPLLAALGGLAVAVGGWIAQTGAILGADLVQWGTAFVAWVAPTIPRLLASLADLGGQAVAWIREETPVVIGALAAWSTAFVDWVAPAIPPMLQALHGLGTTAYHWVVDQIPGWKDQLGGWAQQFGEWIGPATIAFLGRVPELTATVLNFIERSAGPILNQLGLWSLSFIDWIPTGISMLVPALAAILGAVTVFIAQSAPVILARLAEWANHMGQWVYEHHVLERMAAALNAILDQFNTWGQQTGEWVRGKLYEIGTSLVDRLRDGFNERWSTFLGAAQEKWDGIKRYFDEQRVALANAILNPFIDARNAIGGVVDAVKTNVLRPLNDALKGMQSFVDGFRSAVNGVSQALLGTNIVPAITVPLIYNYARGTQFHPGGPAIVDEEGKEIITIPGVGRVLRLDPGPGLLPNLPQGSRVTPHAQTRRMLSDVGGGDDAYDPGLGRGQLWSGGVVPYRYNEPFGLKSLVETAMRVWEATGSVRFMYDAARKFNDFLIISTGTGSNSAVGKQGGGQWFNLSPNASSRNALHELGHALGLRHEHQRADRDNYIRVLWENILPGKEHDFTTGDFGGGAYDIRSIMHYPSDAFSRNGQPTILARNGSTIGLQTTLTAADMARVRSLYGSAAATPTNDTHEGESVLDQISGAISGATNWLWDLLAQGADAAIDAALNAFGVNLQLPGVLGQLAGGVMSKTRQAAIDWLTGASSGGDGGGGVAPGEIGTMPASIGTLWGGVTYTGRYAQALNYIFSKFPGVATTYPAHNSVGGGVSADLWTNAATKNAFADNRGVASMTAMANFIAGNLGQLGIRYVLWNRRRNYGDGWVDFGERGNNNDNHYSHVHTTSAFANGGWLREPIVGRGVWSGGRYTLGEREPEYVIPRSKMRNTEAQIINHYYQDSTTVHANYAYQPEMSVRESLAIQRLRRGRGR